MILTFSGDISNTSGQIVQGTNLNGDTNISTSVGEESVSFFFQESFFEQLVLENDTMMVEFNAMTNDDISLFASTQIIFEL